MPDPVEINELIQDPPFGWTSRYYTFIEDDRIDVRLRINLKSDQRIPLRDVLKVRTETDDSVNRCFNQRFEMVDSEGRTRSLKVSIEFTLDLPDLMVRLHPGKGRNNLNHWFVDADPIIRAHEVGHALGLPDEYVDPMSKNRATADAPGIYRDHSLMGNFFSEGVDQAELKQRHGEVLANKISEATGIPLKAQEQPRITPNEPDKVTATRECFLQYKKNRAHIQPTHSGMKM